MPASPPKRRTRSKRSSSQLHPVLPRSPPLPGLPAEREPTPREKNSEKRKSARASARSPLDDPETSIEVPSDSDSSISLRDMFPRHAKHLSTSTITMSSLEEDGKSHNIVVCVRMRPPKPNSSPKSANIYSLDPELGTIQFTDKHPVIAKRGAKDSDLSAYSYIFDSLLLHPNLTQSLYQARISPLVSAAMDGFNGTVFAYGQTSSGKTHTMMGNDSEPGIIPLAIQEVFSTIQQDTDREFLLRVSYLEIYNESLRDLLSPEQKDLTIHQVNGKVTVKPLQEVFVTDPQNILDVLRQGEEARHVGQTDWNDRSSRSHAVFTLTVESHEKSNPNVVRVSQLNLIDLAGSERAASQDDRRKEGSFINKSLLTLGTVINKLTDDKNKNNPGHIPYRDSKLTRLLQTSLSGNARVAIICTISPDPAQATETVSTLNFAKRAKLIVTRAERSTLGDGHSELVQQYLDEIKSLKERLASSEANPNKTLTHTPSIQDIQRIDKAEEEMHRAQDEVSLLRRKLENMSKLVLSGGPLQRPTSFQRSSRGRTSLDTATLLSWSQSHVSASSTSRIDESDEDECDGNNSVSRDVFLSPKKSSSALSSSCNNATMASLSASNAGNLGIGTPLRRLPTSRSISNKLDAVDSPRYFKEEKTEEEIAKEAESMRFLQEAKSTIQHAKTIADAEKRAVLVREEMDKRIADLQTEIKQVREAHQLELDCINGHVGQLTERDRRNLKIKDGLSNKLYSALNKICNLQDEMEQLKVEKEHEMKELERKKEDVLREMEDKKEREMAEIKDLHREKLSSSEKKVSKEMSALRDKHAQERKKLENNQKELVKKHKEAIDSLNNDLSLKIEELVKKTTDLDIYQSNLASTEAEFESFKDKADATISKMESKHAQELKHADKEIETLLNSISVRQKEVDEAVEKRKDLEDKLSIKEKELNDALASKERELNEKQKELEEKLAERKADLDNLLASKKRELDDKLREKQNELDNKLGEKQKELDTLLSGKEKEFDNLLMEKKKELEDKLTSKEKEFNEALTKKQDGLDAALSKRKELEDTLFAKQKELDGLSSKRTVLDATLLSKQTELDNAISKKNEIDSTLSDKQRELDDVIFKRDELNTTLLLKQEEFDSSLASKQKELDDLVSKLKKLEDEVSGKQEELESAQSKNNELESTLSAKQKELDEALLKQKDLDANLTLKREELEKYSELAREKEEIREAKFKEDLASLEKQKELLESNIDTTRKDLDNAKASSEDAEIKYKEQIAKLSDKIKSLESELTTKQRDLDTTKLSIKDHAGLNTKLADKEKDLNDLTVKFDSVKSDLNKKSLQISDLESKLSIKQLELESSLKEATDIKSSNSNSETTNRLQERLALASSQISKLEAESQHTRAQWSEDASRLDKLGEQNITYRTELGHLRKDLSDKDLLIADLQAKLSNASSPVIRYANAANPNSLGPNPSDSPSRSWSLREPTPLRPYEELDIKSLRDKISAAAQRSSSSTSSATLANSVSTSTTSNPEAIIAELRSKVAELEEYITHTARPSSTTSSPTLYQQPHFSSNSNGEEIARLNKVVEGQHTVIDELRMQLASFKQHKASSSNEFVSRLSGTPTKVSRPSTPDTKELRRAQSQHHLREISNSVDLSPSRSSNHDSSFSKHHRTSSVVSIPSSNNYIPQATMTPGRNRKSSSFWTLGHSHSYYPSSPDPLPLPPNVIESRTKRRVTIERDLARLEAEHPVEKNRSALLTPKPQHQTSPTKSQKARILSGMQFLHRSSHSFDNTFS